MALDYFLHLATQREPGEIAKRFAEFAKYERDGLRLEKAAITSYVSETHPIAREMVQDTMGFSPTVSVMFSISDALSTEGTEEMIEDVAHLLAAEPGNAVLIAATGPSVLARMRGTVTLNSAFDGFWSAERQARFRLPHKLAPLPVL